MRPLSEENAYSSEKSERLETRLSHAQKELFRYAADLLGRSLTDFIISSSQEAAQKVIREHKIILLTAEDSQRLANILLNPKKPNTTLKKATKRYKAFIANKNEK